ncbi:MAG: hypothetical protein KDA85_01300 [Planctomycetaceae bacterium]|nr:hypothetical protein [Planctomycetaceae bacterium]
MNDGTSVLHAVNRLVQHNPQWWNQGLSGVGCAAFPVGDDAGCPEANGEQGHGQQDPLTNSFR